MQSNVSLIVTCTPACITWQYEISFSYVQVYMEEVYDLLGPESLAKTSLALREHPYSGIYIENVTNEVVRAPVVL